MTRLISIIVCSREEVRYNALAAHFDDLLADDPHELVRIPDARSMCEGYNRGVAQSRGDLLVMCHDDIEILSRDLGERLRWYLARWDVLGVAGTTRLVIPAWSQAGPPYIFGQVTHLAANGYAVSIFGAPRRWAQDIQALDGVFIAARREVVEKIGFDEARFDGFHLYDIDFTYSAFKAGYRLVVANDVNVIHGSFGSFDESWQRYARVFVEKHGVLSGEPRRPFTTASVIVQSKREVLEVSYPTYWEDSTEPSP